MPEDVEDVSYDTDAEGLCEEERAAALLGGDDMVVVVDDELGEDNCLEEGVDPASGGRDIDAECVCKERFRLNDDVPLTAGAAAAVGGVAPFVLARGEDKDGSTGRAKFIDNRLRPEEGGGGVAVMLPVGEEEDATSSGELVDVTMLFDVEETDDARCLEVTELVLRTVGFE
jgi:hypothetical protein